MNANVNTSVTLTDAQMARVAGLLPKPRGNTGVSSRQVLEAVLHVHRHGCSWRDLPPHYGPWHTVYTRARRWRRSGVLARVLQGLGDPPAGASAAPRPVYKVPDEAALHALADALRPTIFDLAQHLKWERHHHPISQFEVVTLMQIEGMPGISASEMAPDREVGAAAMGAAVRRLVRIGLVQSSPRQPRDRRRNGLQLTAAGREVLRSVRASRSEHLVQQFRALEPADRRQLADVVRVLKRIEAGLGQVLP